MRSVSCDTGGGQTIATLKDVIELFACHIVESMQWNVCCRAIRSWAYYQQMSLHTSVEFDAGGGQTSTALENCDRSYLCHMQAVEQ